MSDHVDNIASRTTQYSLPMTETNIEKKKNEQPVINSNQNKNGSSYMAACV